MLDEKKEIVNFFTELLNSLMECSCLAIGPKKGYLLIAEVIDLFLKIDQDFEKVTLTEKGFDFSNMDLSSIDKNKLIYHLNEVFVRCLEKVSSLEGTDFVTSLIVPRVRGIVRKNWTLLEKNPLLSQQIVGIVPDLLDELYTF
jgi:hypothetical protein